MGNILLLSSSKFIQNDLTDILGKPLGDLRIAHVVNASKDKGVGNLFYMERTRNIFKENNCYFEDLDLDGKTESQLRDILNDFNAVFVNGGNTFYLLKSIRESGFDKVIKELLPTGFIYMGASAGSYVACPTIEMATWKHQDKYDRYGITDFHAMNLAPFLMSVHYTPEYHDLLKEQIKKTNYPVKVLNDDQAVLIKNGSIKLLGGDEIIL